MQVKPQVMVDSFMHQQTSSAQSQVAKLLKLAEALKKDPECKVREAKGLCALCYYRNIAFETISGSAVTCRPCMCCNEPQTYGSTKTDVLCLGCAQKESLCKRCGADDKLILRNAWPKPYSE